MLVRAAALTATLFLLTACPGQEMAVDEITMGEEEVASVQEMPAPTAKCVSEVCGGKNTCEAEAGNTWKLIQRYEAKAVDVAYVGRELEGDFVVWACKGG